MPYIKKEFIDKVLDNARIEEVIGQFVELKKSGANFKGLSPFTSEKSPSFLVSPVKQIFKCFSSGLGGNVVNFLMRNNMTYTESIEFIARKYNMIVEYDDTENAKAYEQKQQEKDKNRPVLEASQQLFYKTFQELDNDHPAKLEVFQKRHYTTDDIIEWGIGFTPGVKFLYNKLLMSANTKIGQELGLINIKNYDVFQERVMYPIHDKRGLIIGFGGRDISGKKTSSKWINSSDSILYDKKRALYGIHKAQLEIRKQNNVYLVEGYNDVIAFHKYGVSNTVASCGTSLTNEQISILRKLTSVITLVFDPDAAGVRAMLKYIPVLLQADFRVLILELPNDPDEFCKYYLKEIKDFGGLKSVLTEPTFIRDGFGFYMDNQIPNNATEVEKSQLARLFCSVIATIHDESMVEIYTKWVNQNTGIKLTTIKKWLKEEIEIIEAKLKEPETFQQWDFVLPKDVKIPFKELESDIKTYQLFMANNMIYMSLPPGIDGKIHFTSVSNFEISVLQHMTDEKHPLKLIRVKNIYGLETVFDTPSESINTPQSFDNMVTAHGNYRFDGNRSQLLRLRAYLLDKMGVGKKIDVLGWQPQSNFFCWNNLVVTHDGSEIEIDENGQFVYNNIHYYVPSANKIYEKNNFKYEAQKKFRVIYSDVPFELFLKKIKIVHRDHAISAILFGISSLFQDIIVEQLQRFPLLFFYGPGSTGKDELSYLIQSFTGIPQTPISLEADTSTVKAQVREFAQFRNGICQLSEYVSGVSKLNGLLKGLWDRNGYKRGNIESYVGSESVPIESSAIITGNQYPDAEPLILRLVWNEMTKVEFSPEEMKHFDELKDMVAKGVSGYGNSLLKWRSLFEKSFSKKQRERKEFFVNKFDKIPSRIVFNLSVLSSVYDIFKDIVPFPFDEDEMIDHFAKGLNQQMRKINANSVLNKFWQCFIISLRGIKGDRIQVNEICKVEQNLLYFNWKHTFGKIQRQWHLQYKEMAPGPSHIQEELENAGHMIGTEKHYTFKSGKEGIRSSAYVVNLNVLDEVTRIDITSSILYQLQEDSLFNRNNEVDDSDDLFSNSSPATPEKYYNNTQYGRGEV